MVLLQFNISVGEETRPTCIHMKESAGVDELFRKVSAECANDVNPEDIRLVFGDVQLEYNKNNSFKDYSLVHMSTLTLLVRLHGGGNSMATLSQDKTSCRLESAVPLYPGLSIDERFSAIDRSPTRTQESSTPMQHVVQLGLKEVPTWAEAYDRDKEELLKCFKSKGETWKQAVESEYRIDPKINSKVSIFEGDITSLKVGGIVSPNNSTFVSTGGVSLRISTVAGPKLKETTSLFQRFDTGQVKITTGFNLPATYIVHTVSPEVEDPKLLESCYRNCIEGMREWSMKSLAFPCIGTGSCGYPSSKAVLVALKTVRVWLEEQKRKQQLDRFERIIFCLFTPGDASLYKAWMQVFFPCSEAHRITNELLPLPGFIETTTTEPDILGLDYESPVLAKMPCGHVIGPLSMTTYCRDLLQKGRYRFICPSSNPKPCNREWEYFLVRHVARLTQEEMHNFEKQISENYLKKADGMQRCPGCQTWCFRAAGTGICVRCAICPKVNGKHFDFCWWCLNTWKSSSVRQSCGNAGCDGRDARVKTLENCPTKEINGCTNCPSIRGCPKCGILIEHKDKCGHMNCTNCGDYGFCFICLGEKKNGKWSCSPWRGTCKLAPRQTTLSGTL